MTTTVALAGSGWISAVHGLAIRALGGARVTHVASRTRENAVRRAAQMGAEACGYDDLPAGAEVVIVCTPPACHAADAVAALRAGAAVIVEKPLCRTLAEADRLVDLAGGRLGYAENLAFAPVVVEALERVSGLGDLHHVEVRAVQGRPTWGEFLTWHWGGGALFDLGVHPLAVALLLAGDARPVSVSGRLEGADDLPTDEHAELSVRFDSGLVARIVSSWRGGEQGVWDFEAASATGVLRGELLPVPSLEHDGEGVPLPPLRTGGRSPQLEQYGYLDQLGTFLADFAAGREPVMSAAFGRAVLDIVCAAYHSARHGGAEEPLPFTGPRDRTPLELWRPS